MEKNNLHVPVLLHETIELLNVKKGGIYVDCTTGRGGHSCEIYKKIGKEGKLICIDTDSEAIDYLTKKFAGKKNIIVVKGNFNQLESILKKNNIDKVDGILADLGVSSPMFDNEDRGFSYHNNGKIDMRMDLEQKNSAADIINNYSFAEMFKVFKTYGEIKNPRNVINVIIKRRKEHPILEIKELVEIIKNNTKWDEKKKEKHPAKTYFQALRIETNNELDNLKNLLSQGVKLLKKDGVMAIISFHSLEDKIVKDFFSSLIIDKTPKELPIVKKSDFVLTNKKPILGDEEENKRARSAKLRGVKKNV